MNKDFEISKKDLMNPATVTINPYWLEAHLPLYKSFMNSTQIMEIEKNIERLKILFPNAKSKINI